MSEEKKIPIVEDDPNIGDVIEIHVNDIDYGLERAMDGETGLRKVLERDYPLIIMDLMLPKLDGLEV
jgi:DNA-binding response OmpR family regulator